MSTQTFPYPEVLDHIIEHTTYRPNWRCSMRDIVRDRVDPADDTSEPTSQGLTVIITTHGYDSYHFERGDSYRVNHYFPVPPATYDYNDWVRWLFDCYRLVEEHEAMEFFTVDGVKPYAPLHKPGRNPYIIHDPADDLSRRTSYRGVLNA